MERNEEESLVVPFRLRSHGRRCRSDKAQLLDADRDRSLPEVVGVADRIARPQGRNRLTQRPLAAGGVLADSGQGVAKRKGREPSGAS